MIVDASVAFKWIFIEDGSDAAISLLGDGDLRAPSLLLIEIGNALWKKRGRGEMGDQESYAAKLGMVASLVAMTDETEFIPRALEMALALDHAIYDCVYLAMAERNNDRMISADARFLAKVARSPWSDLQERLA